jgi:hypothetical protein
MPASFDAGILFMGFVIGGAYPVQATSTTPEQDCHGGGDTMNDHLHSDAGGTLKSPVGNGDGARRRAARRTTASTLIVCVLGAMLYSSYREVSALALGNLAAGAFSSAAPLAIAVGGSPGPQDAAVDRSSTQPDEPVPEISATISTTPSASFSADTSSRLGYRESTDSWVKYLHYLQVRVDTITSANPLRAALEARLVQEKIEFGKVYPGTNIDALLSAAQ